LRAADIMWFGLLMGIVPSGAAAGVPAFIVVLGVLTLTVFVAPFFNIRKRPLPGAFAALCVLLLLNTDVLQAFVAQHQFLLQNTALL
jgi:hypothetical protein